MMEGEPSEHFKHPEGSPGEERPIEVKIGQSTFPVKEYLKEDWRGYAVEQDIDQQFLQEIAQFPEAEYGAQEGTQFSIFLERAGEEGIENPARLIIYPERGKKVNFSLKPDDRIQKISFRWQERDMTTWSKGVISLQLREPIRLAGCNVVGIEFEDSFSVHRTVTQRKEAKE